MKVLLTRQRGANEELAARLRRFGVEVEICPLVATEAIDDGSIDVAGYDWVVVTSARGARELARRQRGYLRHVAAIGAATASALAEHGIEVDFVPTQATQDALVAEFPRPHGSVLFVGAEEARRLVVTELDADFRPVYRTRPVGRRGLPEADVAVVASPSAARALAGLDPAVPVVSIGPQTSAAATDAGLRVVAEAATQDLDGLVAAVREVAG